MDFDFLSRIRKGGARRQSSGDDRKLLQNKFRSFTHLLAHNNTVLEIMADMEEKISGEYVFDKRYIETQVRHISEGVYAIIRNLNELANEKYHGLYDIFRKIDDDIQQILSRKSEIPVSGYTVPLGHIDRDMVSKVGGKNANLGEVENRLRLPVPDGFAISAYAFKRFMEHNDLPSRINEKLRLLDLSNMELLNALSSEIRGMITGGTIPDDLRESILNAYSGLARKGERDAVVSVRSSAVQEDGEFSFAGQYSTVLGVRGQEELLSCYREVLSSLFTPRAIYYYRSRGFTEDDMVMALGVMTMVDAKVSGVMYSHDPNDPKRDVVIINAVWGLGTSAVDGRVSPDVYVVSKAKNIILEKKAAAQEVMLVLSPKKGVLEVKVPEYLDKGSCLSDRQVMTLARFAGILEDYYGRPQDVEWAIDRDDTLYVLQTRPLRVLSAREKPRPVPIRIPGYRVLLEKGTIACKGIASGKARVIRKDEDLSDFPAGSVLIARHTSTKFVTVMDRAAAIITDVGSATGHMASLSREFQVPTLLNTGDATSVIRDGQEITVDAVSCNVYDGRVEEIIAFAGKKEDPFRSTPLFRTFRRILKRIVPLHLIDPEHKGFTVDSCKTFHDITRFAHEKSMAEMFIISDRKDLMSGHAVKLALAIPLDIRLLDIGQGIEEGYRKKIMPENLLSKPLKAFLQGMAQVKWPSPKPADIRSIPSAMQRGQLYEKSFAMVSRDYMNFSIRLGYHLSTVEAYAGKNTNDNYIQFFFKGGGASMDRRLRRVALIRSVMEKMDFTIRCTGDVIEAKITKYDERSVLDRLDVLGRFTVYTKQLDMAMFSDAIVTWFAEEFIREHYRQA